MRRLLFGFAMLFLVAGATTAQGVDKCGDVESPGNPQGCCNNLTGQFPGTDGNCTWWAWAQAKTNWGISLPMRKHASTWANEAKKPGSGLTVLSPTNPAANTIAVKLVGDGYPRGHVAWVTSVDGDSVTYSEMNCIKALPGKPLHRGVEEKTKPSSFFTGGFIYFLELKDFLKTPMPVFAEKVDGFDAQFKIKNNSSSSITIESRAIAINKSNGIHAFDCWLDSQSHTIAAGATLDSGGAHACTINSVGNYFAVAKVMVNGAWMDLGSLGFAVTAIPFEPTHNVSGTIRANSNSGPVLHGVTVYLDGTAKATTDASGAYRINDVSKGRHTLKFMKDGFADRSQSINVTGNLRGQNFYLLSAPVPKFTYSGYIHNGSLTGPGLGGATVSLAGKTATTSFTGYFSIPEITRGTYPLSVSKSGYNPNPFTTSVPITGAVTNANWYLTAIPIPRFTYSGIIHDGSLTGPGLAGATVSFAGKTATTSSTGYFSIPEIPGGTYPLSVSKSGYDSIPAPGFAPLVTINSTITNANWWLPRTVATYSFSGYIHDGSLSGPGLAGATVSLAGKTATTDYSGWFSISGISIGSYPLSVSKPGYDSIPAPSFAPVIPINSNLTNASYWLPRRRPIVTSVSPLSVTLNLLTTFTVYGTDLRAGMAFYIPDCAGVTDLSGGTSVWLFRCTPSYSRGSKTGVIKDSAGGTILKNFSVMVN
ncbi:MAG: carboxypeptidase regulatory-like domain-containing protein [Nitrospinae bacterium]|nr:carboxypeptidase regulatory-like domain-containing protein [Nitrospinota bacterium]MBF0633384.1 carboxypeptidase regulatory-like domain-containing protein [Nitrospinota bacterium]